MGGPWHSGGREIYLGGDGCCWLEWLYGIGGLDGWCRSDEDEYDWRTSGEFGRRVRDRRDEVPELYELQITGKEI